MLYDQTNTLIETKVAIIGGKGDDESEWSMGEVTSEDTLKS